MYFNFKIFIPHLNMNPDGTRKNALEFTIYKIYTFGITGFLKC